MSIRWTQLILTFAATTVSCALSCQGAGSEIRVGVAMVDITPPLGIPMAGYYHAGSGEKLVEAAVTLLTELHL